MAAMLDILLDSEKLVEADIQYSLKLRINLRNV